MITKKSLIAALKSAPPEILFGALPAAAESAADGPITLRELREAGGSGIDVAWARRADESPDTDAISARCRKVAIRELRRVGIGIPTELYASALAAAGEPTITREQVIVAMHEHCAGMDEDDPLREILVAAVESLIPVYAPYALYRIEHAVTRARAL